MTTINHNADRSFVAKMGALVLAPVVWGACAAEEPVPSKQQLKAARPGAPTAGRADISKSRTQQSDLSALCAPASLDREALKNADSAGTAENHKLEARLQSIEGKFALVRRSGSSDPADRLIVVIREIGAEQKTLLTGDYLPAESKTVQNQIKQIVEALKPPTVYVSGVTEFQSVALNEQLTELRTLEQQSYQHQLLLSEKSPREIEARIKKLNQHDPDSIEIDILEYLLDRNYKIGRLARSGIKQAAVGSDEPLRIRAAESDELFVALVEADRLPLTAPNRNSTIREIFEKKDRYLLNVIAAATDPVSVCALECSRDLCRAVSQWNTAHPEQQFQLIELTPLELAKISRKLSKLK